MEEYMPVRYRPMTNEDPSNHGHGHGLGGSLAGMKRSADDSGMNAQQHHHHQQYGMCDTNGLKQSGMGPGLQGQGVVSVNSPVGGGSGVQSQVQDPQPSTSHTGEGQKAGLPNGKKTKGRVKIKMEFIDNKLRRYTTFSKRKTGIMKKAYELSTLTGTQVMLLVASETGHVYTFATRKLQPMITSDTGKDLIQMCLNSPDPPSDPRCQVNDPRGQPSGFEETDLTYSVDDEKGQEFVGDDYVDDEDDDESPQMVNGGDSPTAEEYSPPSGSHMAVASARRGDESRSYHSRVSGSSNSDYDRQGYDTSEEKVSVGRRSAEMRKTPPGLLPIAGKSSTGSDVKRGRGIISERDQEELMEIAKTTGASYLIQTPQGLVYSVADGREFLLPVSHEGRGSGAAVGSLPQGTCVVKRERGNSSRK